MVIAWYNLEYHADVMGVVTTNSCNVTAQVHHGVHLPKNNMALSWYFQLLWSYIVFSLSLSLILSLKYDKTAFLTRAILLPWYWYFKYCCIEIPCYMNILRFKNVLWWHHGTVLPYYEECPKIPCFMSNKMSEKQYKKYRISTIVWLSCKNLQILYIYINIMKYRHITM